ncbi:MAG TPA: hypothetical protein PLD20_04715 [Blastocatellia bacterium]|nr:hypothetical protein [Blastocatellia bacterium]HMV81701.1 hypothetical protein [Blastocatellia bacterium]HMX24565.1 hypothetical protein [Blastocatellia bacterium]HMY74223.1 hypothetical protein [Blastocatellia bacterium]HMZ17210.1 hypothetical protein [Blastocatellia bacterium]
MAGANESNQNKTRTEGLLLQGWIGLACWMAVGLLLEGLLGYKAPGYLNDPQRRELFRLAHTHGTLLSAVLVLAALTARQFGAMPQPAQLALRIGSVLMPMGFLLAGTRHPEGDPGLAIWLVPPGALLIIFGVTARALSLKNSGQDS